MKDYKQLSMWPQHRPDAVWTAEPQWAAPREPCILCKRAGYLGAKWKWTGRWWVCGRAHAKEPRRTTTW